MADDPQATLEKAEVIMRAALSVAEPSTADRQVAADARAMAAEARAEILRIESNEQGSEAAKSQTMKLFQKWSKKKHNKMKTWLMH